VDRSNYGYADSPGYQVVLNKRTGTPIVAIRAADNVLLLNADATELEDKLLRDELRIELGASCFGTESENFVTDWDTGIVYIGDAARHYSRMQTEGKLLN
jgi:hypothetical protein